MAQGGPLRAVFVKDFELAVRSRVLLLKLGSLSGGGRCRLGRSATRSVLVRLPALAASHQVEDGDDSGKKSDTAVDDKEASHGCLPPANAMANAVSSRHIQKPSSARTSENARSPRN